jgi:hypothetical protein
MLTVKSDSDDMTGPGSQAPRRAHAALARDAALARIGHARRWVVLGSAGLSAGFAALVSTSPPSKASTKTTRPTSSTSARPRATRPGAEPALPPLADGSKLGLSGPSQSPSSDNQAPAPQADPSQQQAPSAPAPQVAPSPQPGPVSGGS